MNLVEDGAQRNQFVETLWGTLLLKSKQKKTRGSCLRQTAYQYARRITSGALLVLLVSELVQKIYVRRY